MNLKSIEYSLIWIGLILSLFATSCRNEELTHSEMSISSSGNESVISISGKLAQAYVGNASIILDRKLSGSQRGNCTQDAGEGRTQSDPFGAFSISASHHDFVICTIGGTYKNSKGDSVPASPMLAPAPDSSNSAWNVTPLTTLVTTHAELKNKLDEMGGWNADIASPEGVPGRLLRLAKTVETFDQMTKQLNQDDQKRLKALEYLANSFKLNGVSTDNTTLLTSAKIALHNVMNDTEIITNGSDAQSLSEEAILNQMVNVLKEGVFSAITNTNVTVVEQEILSKVEIATDNATKAISGMLKNPPVLSWIRTIPKFTSDSTPSFEFQSTKNGEIALGGGCLSDFTSAEYGINKITLKELNQGFYENCTISVTDQSGNKSEPLIIESFTIDTTSPVLKETSSIKTPSSVANPEYSFHTDESGNIFFNGDCNSENNFALEGENTITLSSLHDGIYENCTISVVDKAGNVSNQLKLGSFEIVANGSLEPDTKPPSLILMKEIESLSKDRSPSFTITSTEEGKLKTSGSCKSSILEVTTGENEITLNPLDDGTYSDCLVYVTDMFGNQSLTLNLSEFTVDSTEPVLEIVTPISTPGNNSTPTFEVNSSENGTISFSGGCSSMQATLDEGVNSINLSHLQDGTYENCKIKVADEAGNNGNLDLHKFIIDSEAPKIISIKPEDNSSNVPVSTGIELTFSEPINIGSKIKNTDNDTCQEDFQLSKDNFTSCIKLNKKIILNDIIFSFHPENSLLPNSIYNFRINSKIIDLAGNPLNLENAIFGFQTTDTNSPKFEIIESIPRYTKSLEPIFKINSNEEGVISFQGSCVQDNKTIKTGENEIKFENLEKNIDHKNCKISLTDSSGNSSELILSTFHIDTIVPSVKLVQEIKSINNNPNPSVKIYTSENGNLEFNGKCSNTTNIIYEGNNTIVLDELEDDTYSNCSLRVIDLAGNKSDILKIPEFTIDTISPLVQITSHISSPTKGSYPSFSLHTNESGSLSFEKDSLCLSSKNDVKEGEQEIELSNLNDGKYLCKLYVTDDAGNKSMMVSLNEFEIDRSPPLLTLAQKVPEVTGSKKPDFKFNSSENGTLSFSCNISSTSENVFSGENHVILNELDDKSYDNCSITVLDQAGNRSEELFIDNFTVDTIAPSLKLIEGVPEYTTENSPNIEIEISESGEIVFLDECKGINHIPVFKKEMNYIVINDLDDGRYQNCLIKLVDKAGNISESINLAENGVSFTIDTVKPEIVEEVPVETFSTTLDDLTYIFKSSEDGLIYVQGKCRSLSENAIEGSNTIYFINSPDNYTDCKLQVVDFAGNKSNFISLSDFQVIQAEGQSVGFGIGFDPTIEKINCEYNSNDPTRLKISATVKDDGPISQLRYFWKFCKYCDTFFERTKKFTNEFSNPTFMKDYSINETSGTLYLEVTDGNGLGGKTTKELKISPASC